VQFADVARELSRCGSSFADGTELAGELALIQAQLERLFAGGAEDSGDQIRQLVGEPRDRQRVDLLQGGALDQP
jgi:hypothetical protein